MRIKSYEWTLLTGEVLVIKSATAQDAEQLAIHRKITSSETYFLARYPEECCFEMEKMKSVLQQTEEHPQNFMVTAFMEGKIIGDLGVTQVRNHLKYTHRAYMGISIQNAYCNLGLGSKMIEIALKQARENGFEQMELGVFEDNFKAIHVYEKHGFQKYGVQPRAYKLKDGTYRDEVIMVKLFKED